MTSRNVLLVFLLVTHLFCLAAGGHGIAPIGYLEYFIIKSIVSGNFALAEISSLWIVVVILTIAGQALIAYGLIKGDRSGKIDLAFWGTIALAAATVVLGTSSGEYPMFFVISSAPFFILWVIFFVKNESAS